MFSFKGISVKIFAAIMGLIAIAAGIWILFFHSRGFEETTATIISLKEEYDSDNGITYRPTVEYTVDGKTYTGELDSSSGTYKVGKTIKVLYDPGNPSVVHSGSGIGIYLLVVGVLILAVIVVSEVREKKALKELRNLAESRKSYTYAPSGTGMERKLYFLTDLGTAKYGHRIEDQDRHNLFEAKMTKFTTLTPFGFDFLDHEHQRVTPHLIGHEESTEMNSLLFDNHYTFTYDGEDIWKHLKRNGIRIESALTGPGGASGNGSIVGTTYRIFRDEREIAFVEASSQNVHEEDAEKSGKLGNLIPVRGFYRIQTKEEDLELLFVVLLAFARSGANDGRGGSRGALLGAMKNLGNRA